MELGVAPERMSGATPACRRPMPIGSMLHGVRDFAVETLRDDRPADKPRPGGAALPAGDLAEAAEVHVDYGPPPPNPARALAPMSAKPSHTVEAARSGGSTALPIHGVHLARPGDLAAI